MKSGGPLATRLSDIRDRLREDIRVAGGVNMFRYVNKGDVESWQAEIDEITELLPEPNP